MLTCKNQYHLWLLGNGKNRKGIVRGDFGISYSDGQQISTKIWDKLWISFALAFISILIAYLVSIPIGIYSAYKKDSAVDKGISLILFILYSLPVFFVGVLLLLAFACNTEANPAQEVKQIVKIVAEDELFCFELKVVTLFVLLNVENCLLVPLPNCW